jgi:hypothetical protein
VIQHDWSEFWELLLWGSLGILLGVTAKVRRDNPKDPAEILYNLQRVAKYGGYMTGTALLFGAFRVLIRLIR